MTQRIVLGDCLDVFRDVRGLGAIVSDPPAGIGFMGRSWDKDRGGRAAWIAYWAERFAVALDACEDNAVGLFWALPRTSHWTATAVEDAGWHIRDVITHHFGQGWPKDKNALKPATEHWILAVKGKPTLGIDACRVERGIGGNSATNPVVRAMNGCKPAKQTASRLFGRDDTGTEYDASRGSWPTNLVLSHAESCEPCGTRKVRSESGTRGLGKAHVGGVTTGAMPAREVVPYHGGSGLEEVPAYLCAVGCDCGRSWLAESGGDAPRCECGLAGWWACPIAEMDAQSGDRPGMTGGGKHRDGYAGGMFGSIDCETSAFADRGGGSRFFPRFHYFGKAPSCEKHAGCENLFWRADKRDPFGFVRVTREEWEALDPKQRAESNVHPTPKRLALMRWLHKLTGATRIGDLCGGSGSGMIAAYLDGIDWIGAEVCPQAIDIAEARLAFWKGLSFEARERFLTDDVVPKAEPASPKQTTLF